MSLEQQLLKLKTQLKKDENDLVRIETEKKIELKELHKKGITTKEKAREQMAKWRLKHAAIQKEIQAKMDSINELYGAYL